MKAKSRIPSPGSVRSSSNLGVAGSGAAGVPSSILDWCEKSASKAPPPSGHPLVVGRQPSGGGSVYNDSASTIGDDATGK